MLSDALAAVAVVTMLALLVHSAMQVTANADAKIKEAYQHAEETYEEQMERIGECVCETPEPTAEATDETDGSMDTSLNSY